MLVFLSSIRSISPNRRLIFHFKVTLSDSVYKLTFSMTLIGRWLFSVVPTWSSLSSGGEPPPRLMRCTPGTRGTDPAHGTETEHKGFKGDSEIQFVVSFQINSCNKTYIIYTTINSHLSQHFSYVILVQPSGKLLTYLILSLESIQVILKVNNRTSS